MPIAIDQLVQEFLINGNVVLDDFIPTRKAEVLHAELLPMLEKVRARNSRESSGDLDTGRGRVTEPLRYKIETPWRMPFSDPRNHPIRMAARDFRELSERGKRLLSRSRRVEALN